jgi:ADP-heptose:LPS heptosyltransferase
MASPDRICIFLTGGIGDFVAAVPAMVLLRKNFPLSRIVLVGNPTWLPLALECEIVDQVRSIDDLPLHAGFMSSLPEEHPLSRFLAGFDLIISWFGDREGQWEGTLRGTSSGKVLVHPFHRVHTFPGHVSDYYLATLKDMGLREREEGAPGRQPLLRLRSRADPNTANGREKPCHDRPFLCLHPGSGSEHKNWPKEDFLEVARGAFRSWRLPSTVLIGPAEEGQKTFWAEASGPSLAPRAGLSILEVSRVLHSATLFVGNDSGITHLAAALGIPVVALFGPTDPGRWAPLGSGVEILLQPVSPQEVLVALGRFHSSIIL